MKLRNITSALAAMALAAGTLATGVGAAWGEQPAAPADATLNTTITITAHERTQLEDHVFSAIRLGDLSQEQGYVSVSTVGSAPDATEDEKALYQDVATAAKENGADQFENYGIDPLSYISGIDPDNITLDPDHEDDVKPWAGSDRAFVDSLIAAGADSANPLAKAPAQTGSVTGDAAPYSVTLAFDKPGLYLIFDVTDPANVNAIPILVATQILNAKNHSLDADGNDAGQWPSPYAGQVEMKSETLAVSKTVDKSRAIPGNSLSYLVSGTLPATKAFTSDVSYPYSFADQPGVGQTVNLKDIEVFVDANRNGAKDNDESSLVRGTDYLVGLDTDGDYAIDDPAVTTPETLAGDGDTGFVIDLGAYVNSEDYKNTDGLAGLPVAIAYTAVMTGNAVDTVVNDVTLSYSLDPTNEMASATAEASTSVTVAPVYGFGFVKTDKAEGDQAKKLNGVTFKIYAGSDPASGEAALRFIQGTDGAYKFASENTEKSVDELRTANGDGIDGMLRVAGLEAGDYTVVETGTVEGFTSQLLAKFKVSILGEDEKDADGDGVPTKEEDLNGNGKLDKAGTITFTDLRNWGSLGSTIGVDDIQGTSGTSYMRVINYRNITDLPMTGGAGLAVLFVAALLGAGATVLLTVATSRVRRAGRR